MGQLREVSNKAHNAELKLFLEVETGVVVTFYNSCLFFIFLFHYQLSFKILEI